MRFQLDIIPLKSGSPAAMPDNETDDDRHHDDGHQDHEANDDPVSYLREVMTVADEHQHRGGEQDQAETALALAVAMVVRELAGCRHGFLQGTKRPAPGRIPGKVSTSWSGPQAYG
jgi:hypothetical protein